MNVRSIFFVFALLTAPWQSAVAAPTHDHSKSLGVASCASSLCHGAIEPWLNSTVQQNEYVTWSRSDKHARAYAVLSNERSLGIAKRLGMKEAPNKAALCLDCHAHNPPPERRGESFVLADGVSCESCHGAAEGWIKQHVEPKASHADNLAHGLYPLSKDVARARLCLSCHLGNDEKFVSHKMMAAGHPRMSFELDTFTQIAPAHFRIDADWQKRKGEWNGARAWAVGQVVATQQLLSLLLSPKRGRDGLFPELVLFDCHSCHHAMSDKRNSSARVGAGPGVMRLNDASLLMVAQIARRVEADRGAAIAQQIARLHSAIAGGNDALAQARTLQDMLAKLLPRLESAGFSAMDLRLTLNSLIDEGLAGQYRDYQGAEQSAMAVQSIVDVMGRQGLLRTSALASPLKSLLAAVGNDEKYQPAAFEQALREVKRGIATGAVK